AMRIGSPARVSGLRPLCAEGCFWLVATQSRPLSAYVPFVMRQGLMAAEALRGAPYLPALRTAAASLERIPLMAAVAAPGCARGGNPPARGARHTHHQESLLGSFSLPGGFGSAGVVFHPLLKRVERVGREAHWATSRLTLLRAGVAVTDRLPCPRADCLVR